LLSPLADCQLSSVIFFVALLILSFDASFSSTRSAVLVEAAQDQDSSNNVPGREAADQGVVHLRHFFTSLTKLLLRHLRELKAEKTINGKAFYKSYIKWEELNQMQRNKTISFWVSNLTDGIHYAIKTCVEQDLANDNAEEANRASITNKHDKAHLLHLCVDPTAAALWTEALPEKD